MRYVVALVAMLLAAACNERAATTAPAQAAPAKAPQPVLDEEERDNLLNIAFGASVVSRTAELTLDQSAVRAIDGDPGSAWNSPPSDTKDQTIVFALGAPTRIEKVGIRTAQPDLFRVTALQVDTSLDNVAFTPLLTMHPQPVEAAQLFGVEPRDALYVRITTIEAAGRFARLESVHVRGKFLKPVAQEPISGCWTINGVPASFAEDRGRVTGVIGTQRPISFDGGADGMVYRFVWTSGPDFGFGAIDTAPDKKHLSGLRWYIEPINFAAAESWFGERSGCRGTLKQEDVMAAALRRIKRFPLFGLRFDDKGQLNESESEAGLEMLAGLVRAGAERPRLVSREFRMKTPADNQRRAQVRLESLQKVLVRRGIDSAKFDWTVAGSDTPPRPIETEIQRTLYGVIELQK